MNSSEDLEIKITSDGSPTVYSKQFDATFHSSHGALQESLHVFIKNGFAIAAQHFPEIRILEVGFGTGLNALLTLKENKRTVYHTVEKYPLPKSIYEQLDFGFGKEELLQLHNCDWEKDTEIGPLFNFHKSKADIRDIPLHTNYDLIYFDAFAPVTQQELWQNNILQKMYDHLVPGGILVTFCAKGDFKRALKNIGFTVQSPKGAAGKREMTRALKLF